MLKHSLLRVVILAEEHHFSQAAELSLFLTKHAYKGGAVGGYTGLLLAVWVMLTPMQC